MKNEVKLSDNITSLHIHVYVTERDLERKSKYPSYNHVFNVHFLSFLSIRKLHSHV